MNFIIYRNKNADGLHNTNNYCNTSFLQNETFHRDMQFIAVAVDCNKYLLWSPVIPTFMYDTQSNKNNIPSAENLDTVRVVEITCLPCLPCRSMVMQFKHFLLDSSLFNISYFHFLCFRPSSNWANAFHDYSAFRPTLSHTRAAGQFICRCMGLTAVWG